MCYKLPTHHFLDFLVAEKVTFRESSHHIVVYKFEYFLLLSILLKTRVFNIGINHNEVLFALALESRLLILSIGRHVFHEKFPNLAAEIYMTIAGTFRDSIPGQALQLFEIYDVHP